MKGIQKIIDFQKWLLTHINQLYLWLMITTALNVSITYFKIYHPITFISNIILLLLIYYITWVFIFNDFI